MTTINSNASGTQQRSDAATKSTPQISVGATYHGSDGATTRRLMTLLKKKGSLGDIAAQLFRAQKASSRAKQYRGGIHRRSGGFDSFRDLAYEKKEESLCSLSDLLDQESAGLDWGWQTDPKQTHAKWILYVELPNGQCSFHSPSRFSGPDFEGKWDQKHLSEQRIIEFCESVLAQPETVSPVDTLAESTVMAITP